MALVKATLKQDLITAFAAIDWTICGNLMGSAFDNFIKSGIVTTTETGSGVTPGGSPFTASGVGKGTITTIGVSALQSTISTLFMNTATLWPAVGAQVAAAINTDVITATISTTITGGLTGIGSGIAGCINTAVALPALIPALTTAFSLPAATGAWLDVADMVSTAMDTFMRAAIVTTGVPTPDAGTVPPTGWTGTGTGTIS